LTVSDDGQRSPFPDLTVAWNRHGTLPEAEDVVAPAVAVEHERHPSLLG